MPRCRYFAVTGARARRAACTPWLISRSGTTPGKILSKLPASAAAQSSARQSKPSTGGSSRTSCLHELNFPCPANCSFNGDLLLTSSINPCFVRIKPRMTKRQDKPIGLGGGKVHEELPLGSVPACACVHWDAYECARIRDGRHDPDDDQHHQGECECCCHEDNPYEDGDF